MYADCEWPLMDMDKGTGWCLEPLRHGPPPPESFYDNRPCNEHNTLLATDARTVPCAQRLRTRSATQKAFKQATFRRKDPRLHAFETFQERYQDSNAPQQAFGKDISDDDLDDIETVGRFWRRRPTMRFPFLGDLLINQCHFLQP